MIKATPRLLIPGYIHKNIETVAIASLPFEACAVLLGHWDGDRADYHIDDLKFAENVDKTDPTRSFEVDPRVLFEVQKQARAGGAQVIGVWHSHPKGEPVPSPHDRARSIETNWVWVITAVDSGVPITKASLSGIDDPSTFQEMKLQILPEHDR